ncbi:MAG TPA: glycoside hydrolase family 44 protein [Paludibaculum sp.]|jgi:hypothetical protein
MILCCAMQALPQAADGPVLRVDVTASRRPISPWVYGANLFEDKKGFAAVTGVTLNRWGGNNASTYNWKADAINIDADWYFETFPGNADADPTLLPDGSRFDMLVEQNRKLGMATMGTIPIMGWLPRSRDRSCSFSVAKYGPQQSVDPWAKDCGNGVDLNKQNIRNDPNDVYDQFGEDFQAEWVRHLTGKYGAGAEGGVPVYSLDNEACWWYTTHRDIHPAPATYDEVRDLGIRYAAAIKAADPTALVAGPAAAGWDEMFYSAKDFLSGWSTRPWKYWSNPVDRRAHGDVPFVEWYLGEMKKYEDEHGVRLLDYVDVHAYITPSSVQGGAGDEAAQALRLRSTRALWDPTYLEHAPEDQLGESYRLVPRLREWVDRTYPGTKIAITEYNWGGYQHITGGLAQADILGIFGREGVDLATLWSEVEPDAPIAFAFKIYRNYDDAGGQFGGTSILAETSDADKLSVFAAERADGALTVLVLNKDTQDLASAVRLDHFVAGGPAQVFRYSNSEPKAILREMDAEIMDGAITATFPSRSMTLFVIPRQQEPVIEEIQQ